MPSKVRIPPNGDVILQDPPFFPCEFQSDDENGNDRHAALIGVTENAT